jgi:hypothetical protein
MTQINKAAKDYSIAMGASPDKYINQTYDGFIAGVEFAQQWISIIEEYPPNDFYGLAKSPDGIIYLCSWRNSYNIFDVQSKTESSSDWFWREIELL